MRKYTLFAVLFLLLAKPLFSANCYTSGTTFTEGWNSGTHSCAGSSVCQQTWTTSSGAASTITSAPSGSFVCSNVLKLPSGATANTLTTYGTIPYIPQNSGPTAWDAYVEYYYDSTNVTAYRKFIQFTYPGAGTDAVYLEESSNGSGQYYINGSAGPYAISASTYHLIHFHLNGGSSYVQIDAGTQRTFTAPAADWTTITLQGDTTGANLYFGNIYVNASSYPGGWPPSSLADFTGGTNGTTVTAALLNGGTHCGDGGTSAWGWAYSAGASTDLVEFDTSNTRGFANSETVCTNAYSGNAGVSIRHNVPAAASPAAVARYTLASTQGNFVIGFYWKVNTTVASVGFTDQGGWLASGGNQNLWHVCGSTNGTSCSGTGGNTSLLFCVENSAGTSSCPVQISNNTWYWVTSQCQSGGSDAYAVYNVNGDGSVGSQVGSNIATSDTGCGSGTATKFQFGAVGSESPGVQLDAYYENPIFEYQDASFPLRPPAGSALLPSISKAKKLSRVDQ